MRDAAGRLPSVHGEVALDYIGDRLKLLRARHARDALTGPGSGPLTDETGPIDQRPSALEPSRPAGRTHA
ncbi:MAG TPA: hypothetical protein VFZ61_20450 [Polyangiales bacterium]